jgi:hypothetical protein
MVTPTWRRFGTAAEVRGFVASDFNMQQLLVKMATLSALHGTEKTARIKSTEAKTAGARRFERGEK